MTRSFPEQKAGNQEVRLLFIIKVPVIYYACVLHEGSRGHGQEHRAQVQCLTAWL